MRPLNTTDRTGMTESELDAAHSDYDRLLDYLGTSRMRECAADRQIASLPESTVAFAARHNAAVPHDPVCTGNCHTSACDCLPAVDEAESWQPMTWAETLRCWCNVYAYVALVLLAVFVYLGWHDIAAVVRGLLG